MNRQTALVLTIFFFIIFLFLTYFCAKVTLWSSIVFSLFVSLILLNLFYPLNKVTDEPSDFTLYIYALFILLSILIIAIYVFQKTLFDVRQTHVHAHVHAHRLY